MGEFADDVDVLDDAGQAVGKIGFEDFVALYEAQKASV
jgi:hypothetical protein